MKTIIIAHNYSQISFAAMSYHLANHLANMGNRVLFISHHPHFLEKKSLKINTGELIICSWPTTKRPTSLQDFFWFSMIYFKYKPHVVIGHFVGSNIAVSVSKILSFGKVKTIEYYHTLSTQILEDLNKLTFKQRFFFIRKKIFYKFFCDLMICPSEMAKDDLKSFFGITKSLVILNPMLDRFKNKTNIAKNPIVISYLGRLDSSKGVMELVHAFETYKKKFKDSKMVLNIAGTGSQQQKIIEVVNDIKDINYRGGLPYDNIDAYLNESHFVIIPSKFDNLPTVGLEAMMNQTPLLISNATGLSHYLTDEKECFKFEPNIDSMVELFEKVEHSFNLQTQMGIDARLTYFNKFSMKNYCDNFSKIIC
ncbi:glycosyltransferase family 4 protein [Flavobacterium sp.]|uniref:glycosyltransferase family 4 protein n=1 Tax=Flavobacterium sp. TaxID=239 RepID=UPI00286D1E87|nr:glycosyltransferase family 4 protein [Flavobacterium sp.]